MNSFQAYLDGDSDELLNIKKKYKRWINVKFLVITIIF